MAVETGAASPRTLTVGPEHEFGRGANEGFLPRSAFLRRAWARGGSRGTGPTKGNDWEENTEKISKMT